MAKYLMGIDNGSTVVKAAIFDLEGNELGVCGMTAEIDSPHPGWYERDAQTLWQANLDAMAGAIKSAGISGEEVLGISITGHGNGAHLLDAQGNAVRPIIEGSDSRALELVNTLENEGYYENVHPQNMQALWPALSAVVMRWLKENEPENYAKIKYFFNVHDYIRFCMTGQAYCEISTISGTGLIDTAKRRIDRSMLEKMGIGEVADMLSPLIGSFDLAGTLTADVAEKVGLEAGTPVFAGCYDIAAAGLATGSVDESRICVISGTWANNQYIATKPVLSRDFFSTTIFSRPGYYLMLEGSPTSASNLEWFVREFLAEEKKQAKAQGVSVYDVCNRAVENTNPQDSDLIFLPFLYGSNVNPLAKSTLIGMQGWHKREHVIRAIYEGICFSHRFHIERLLKHLKPPEAARIAGGGAKSGQWAQMFADVLGMPMEIPMVSELGTLGAAMCAAIGMRIFADTSAAVTAMVKTGDTVTPSYSDKMIYDQKYANYLRAIEALDSFWTN